MPACETCRIRKIRCDRQLPCASCVASNFECKISSRQPRSLRKPGSGDKPIINNVAATIRPKSTRNTASAQRLHKSDTINGPAPDRSSHKSTDSPNEYGLSNILPVQTEDNELQGETSLHAQSIAAQDLLIQTLGDHSRIRDNPRMVAALGSLRRIVEADSTVPCYRMTRLTGTKESRQRIYELKLPPSEVVLDLLRKSKERPIFAFSTPLAHVTRDQFSELCRTVYFRTEDYPISTAIIVHGILGNLFQEFKWSEKGSALRGQYQEWAQLCHDNLERSISDLDMLLPTTMDSAQALLIAASHCMEMGQASVCKKLVVHGCMMLQSLGWNRVSSMQNDSESLRLRKLVVFWMFYTIDQNLCLRLGQASLIQDFEIDLPLPWSASSPLESSLKRIYLWARVARIMGLIYEQLYSPGALKQTDDVRAQSVQILLDQMGNLKPKDFKKDDIAQFIQDSNCLPAPYLYDGSELILRADEVKYHTLLCMIHRAAPASAETTYNAAGESIKHARAAIDCHLRCTVALKNRLEMWIVYLHWTILSTPFVPFTTLFSHALTTNDRADLRRLREFAASMSDCYSSQPAQKVHKLASVFVNVLTIYFELKEQDVQHAQLNCAKNTHLNAGTADIAPAPTYSMAAAWDPFNPFLDALGIGESSSTVGQGMTNSNTDLENWFHGNQHIMELLEYDLSYLDPTELMF